MVKALGFKTKEVELPDFPYGCDGGRRSSLARPGRFSRILFAAAKWISLPIPARSPG